jgi:hypothetical protein
VVSFLQSVGVTFAAAFLAACWHILARNGPPEAEDLAIGFDLVVAAIVLQFGFLPRSHGQVADAGWTGLVLLFAMLMGMTVATRMYGYDPVRIYRPSDTADGVLAIYRMTGKSAWVTSMVGSGVLCVFWWLNVNIGLVVTAWKEFLH